MEKLTHLDKDGKIKMVDIGGKSATTRIAVASAKVFLNEDTINAVQNRATPKGDPLEIARIAGVMGAKKTSELIPLCHQINLSNVDVEANIVDGGVAITATAETDAKTGVEMEALTAVTIAGLTVYDMCKAIQKDIEISHIRLESKSGGKSDYKRQ